MTAVLHVLDIIVDVVAVFIFVGFAVLAVWAAWVMATWGKGK